jgi:NAD(P)-dependent dehydrogenase (short-subunit alcohol dehydrogenase family)
VRLAGKVAIVTGAAGGIGSATAHRLARDGASVLCVDVDADGAQAVVEEVSRSGGAAAALAADVASAEGNRAMVAAAHNAWGRLDILHANAAVQEVADLRSTTPEQWQRLFEVNLRGVAWAVEAALPVLAADRGGSVVITSSLLGIVGDPDLPAYGAMKGGLRALCRSLAAAYGPQGVRVNTICPGDVNTPMLDDFFASQPDPDAARARILNHYPLRRFAEPEDVAAVVAFLGSDDARYLTGIDIVVDGGLLARIY